MRTAAVMADGEEPVGAASRFPVAKRLGRAHNHLSSSAVRSGERHVTPSDSAIDLGPTLVRATHRDRHVPRSRLTCSRRGTRRYGRSSGLGW